jgi:hypothetical protein
LTPGTGEESLDSLLMPTLGIKTLHFLMHLSVTIVLLLFLLKTLHTASIIPEYPGSLVFTDALKIKSNWLDYGKIRAGWARVGNDAPPNNGKDVFVINPNFLSQTSTSRNFQTIDPELTPEFTQELELGLDLSLFKRKAMLDVTVYDKTTTDLIYGIDVPSTTGYGSFLTNIGEINNKGIEIGLTLRPITNADFNWEIRGAFTKNKNIVEKLVEGLERAPLTSSGGSVGFSNGIGAYIEAGKPFGYLYGPKTDRLEDGTPLINPATGMMIEGLESGEIGNPTPDYKMGITNTIAYKGFVLSGLFDLDKRRRYLFCYYFVFTWPRCDRRYKRLGNLCG